MDDLVERLRDTGLHSAAVAAARIEYLEKRLEIVPGLSETADGISCRDETIKLQDARITALETALAEAEGRVIAEVVAWLRHQHVEIRAMRSPVRNLDDISTALETGEWRNAQSV